MRVVKEINKSKTYLDKNGKERYVSSYYIECDNDKRIYIKPVFNNSYVQLDFISDIVILEK